MLESLTLQVHRRCRVAAASVRAGPGRHADSQRPRDQYLNRETALIPPE